MFKLKRKYKDSSIEALRTFIFTRFYPRVVVGGYVGMHHLRNLISPLGVNTILLVYVLLLTLLVAQELLHGDPLWRSVLLTLLVAHVIYDLLANVELIYIAMAKETPSFELEVVMLSDCMTFDDRLRRLRVRGDPKALAHAEQQAAVLRDCGEQSLAWPAGLKIRDKRSGQCWKLYEHEQNDYEAHLDLGNQKRMVMDTDDFLFIAVIQELVDRRLSPKRRDQIWNRLYRAGLYIKPCSADAPILLPGETGVIV
jgi:hypothetical protein